MSDVIEATGIEGQIQADGDWCQDGEAWRLDIPGGGHYELGSAGRLGWTVKLHDGVQFIDEALAPTLAGALEASHGLGASAAA